MGILSLQRTIKKEFLQIEKCPYSGHYVNMKVSPAEPDTGIVFQVQRGEVKADYRRAQACRRSILLRQGSAKVLTPEHLLAIFYANGIDNARIALRRLAPIGKTHPSYLLTYYSRELFAAEGMNEPEVVPIIGTAENRLCERIASNGTIEQDKERRTLRLEKPFETEKISFYPIDSDAVVMRVTTDYPASIGEQTEELTITPETFRNEIAGARPYGMHIDKYLFFLPKRYQMTAAKFFASLLNPTLGIGHGFDETNVFLPTKTAEEWRAQERYSGEVARHTMTDKLAILALLAGRLAGVKMVVRPRSNHENDLAVLSGLAKRLQPYKSSSLTTPPASSEKPSILSSNAAYTS
ncbi:UDP-3-O-acyl-N-acetylglucosamine deacetylase [Candidatus Woesearchaeota archaeon]|nr:UDP-3-O-acyl-N-acetylglucosamine deacetylase [Candidatus Woesearchaeota archaeon]